jgi:hypothetical protein
MDTSLMHRRKTLRELTRKNLIAFRTAEPADFSEII